MPAASGALEFSQTKLIAGDASKGDRFGTSVAVGDAFAAFGASILVGSPGDDGPSESGSVYFFVREGRCVGGSNAAAQCCGRTDDCPGGTCGRGTTWLEETSAKQHYATQDPNDQFGQAIAAGGFLALGTTARATAAAYTIGQGVQLPAPFCFLRAGGTLLVGRSDDGAATAVAISEVRKGATRPQDGVDIAVLGMPNAALLVPDFPPPGFHFVAEGGRLRIFTRRNVGDPWTERGVSTPVPIAPGTHLGRSVTISMKRQTGAVSETPPDTVVAGAEGSAFVYVRDGDEWPIQTRLLPDEPAEGFGAAVGMDDDLLTTPGNTVVVGAPDDDGRGAAYVFTRSGSAWIQARKLTAADGAAGDGFGSSVAFSGRLVVIGAPGDDDGGQDAGSAYVFDVGSGGQEAKLHSLDAAGGDLFGGSVDISSLEGQTTIAVGARMHDSAAAGANAGAAYAFVMLTSTATRSPTRTPQATLTSTPTATASSSPTPTRTATPESSVTASRTATPSRTATGTPSATRSATPTSTPPPSPSATMRNTSSATATATATDSAAPTSTSSFSPTRTPPATPSASATPTNTASPSPTNTQRVGLIPVPVTPGPAGSGEFNGSGRSARRAGAPAGGLDLAVGGRDEPIVLLLEGGGDGSFAPAGQFRLPTSGGGLADLVVADVNGDARPDVVASDPAAHAIGVLLGDGPLQLRDAGMTVIDAAPGRIVVRDVNGDGRPDVLAATSDGVTVLTGQGDGGFVARSTVAAGAAVSDLAVLDADGDQYLDLALSVPQTRQVRLYRGDAAARFAAGPVFAVGEPVAIVAGEFSGDAHDDLIVADAATRTLHLLLGALTDAGAMRTLASDAPAQRLAAADVNGDGRLDVLALDAAPGVLRVLRAQAGGGFAPESLIAAGETAAGLAVGDFDGDGRADAVLSVPQSQALFVAPGSAIGTRCAGDCDGDGRVSVSELIVGVNLALGTASTPCAAFDTDSDGEIAISELVAAVNSALRGCP